jgi:hypothetical protein
MWPGRYKTDAAKIQRLKRYHGHHVKVIFRAGDEASSVVFIYGLVSWVGFSGHIRNPSRHVPTHEGRPVLILDQFLRFADGWRYGGKGITLPIAKIESVSLWHPGTNIPHLQGPT